MSTGRQRSYAPIIAACITGLATITAAVIALTWGDHGGGGGSYQKPDYSNRVGVYTGENFDKTTGFTYAASLELRSIDGNSGNVDAYVDFNTTSDPNDLAARGNLFGTIGEDATMNLAGDIYAGQTIWDGKLDCQFTAPEAIECTWNLKPRSSNSSGSHEGTL